MCTAISYHGSAHLFGRTLDVTETYRESVLITPRTMPLHFHAVPNLEQHYAFIGIGSKLYDTQFYYDAVNEHGLAIAGLRFPDNAVYHPKRADRANVTPYELIGWILGQCKTIADVRSLVKPLNLLNIPYNEQLPLAPLHWMVADQKAAIVLEPMADGLHVYENPFGVLTNNPPFPFMRDYVSLYRDVSAEGSENCLAPDIAMPQYCTGIAGHGLPGDFSSPSRFVRSLFLRSHVSDGNTLSESVSAYFHIMDNLAVPKGAVRTENGQSVSTAYTCCCDQNTATYYFITYENRTIRSVSLWGTGEDKDFVL